MAILTWEQVAAVALHAGFPPGDAVIAVAITEPESGRDATIVQAGQPYATTGWGLWQITPGNSVPRFGIDRQLLVASNNAGAAHYKWDAAGGFSPWTTYENGLDRPYRAAAEAAVQAVTHLSRRQLARLVAEADKGGTGTAGGETSVQDWSPYVIHARKHAGRMAMRLETTGRAVRSLHPGRVHPVVRPPSAASLLWSPGQPMPSTEETS